MKNIFLSLLIISFLFSCKKDNEDETTTPAPVTPVSTAVTIESSYRITAKIDGVNYSKITGDGTYRGSSGSSRSMQPLPDSSSARYNSSITNAGFSTTYFWVQKGTIVFQGFEPSSAVFKSFFTPHTYPYDFDATHGISIEWNDGTGMIWSTDKGTGDQTGSNFEITDRKDFLDLTGEYYVKIKAQFNCIVYDDFGQSKTFTDGIYIGAFGNF